MRKMLVIAVLAVMVARASACGGGGEKAAPLLSDADLKSIVTITSEGLPWQVTQKTDGAASNEQASQAFADPSKWLANYEKWGRTGGHMATFTGQAVAVQVEAEAEAYTSIGGAKEAFSAVRAFAESGEALSVYASQGYTGAKIDKIDAAKVGDDSAAYRLQVTANGQQFDTFVILFRRGAVLAQASVGAATNTTDSSAAGTVANQMDGRIQSLLSGQS